MFGISINGDSVSLPPEGVLEFIFCVFDEKGRLHHHFHSSDPEDSAEDYFQFLNNPSSAFDGYVLSEAKKTRKPMSVALSYGDGQRKYLYVLPYERKWGKWHFACIQVTMPPPDPDSADPAYVCALAEERVCLVLVDSQHAIRSASSRVPETFGYLSENLVGMSLQDLFTEADIGVLSGCTPDTNESIFSCTIRCLDGSKRDVEIKKFSAADKLTLYGICDVAPRYRIEELTEVTARERRRIGQDLHDSLGQMLTGISLLSRSLANNLERNDSLGKIDALQVSELADEASNQIRQISRGLMPSDIVKRGFYESLRELARVTSSSCGLACKTEIDESVAFNDVAVEMHLYRIVQEAVNNAVRHADARQIEIVVSEVNGMQQVAVCDDGVWKEPLDTIDGIGMKTMQYRASVIGGQLKVGSMGAGGTKVTCRMELDDSLATRV